MKRTETLLVIPTTFTVFCFLGTWLLALHLKEQAISSEVVMNGLMAGISYIVYVWLALLKNDKILHWLTIVEIGMTVVMAAFVLFTTEGGFDAFFNLEPKDMLILLFYIVEWRVGNSHGQYLRENVN